MKSSFNQLGIVSMFVSLTLVACSMPKKLDTKLDTKLDVVLDTTQVQATWVVMGEQGQAIARAITLESTCPILQQDGVKERMHIRAVPATIAQRVTVNSTALSKPSAFPVLTCELPLRSGITSASIDGKALPLPKPVPLKILVIGDTGCRLDARKDYFQACNDVEQWPFSTVAKTAAGFAPDLVVHVGDYQYRETACPENEAGCAGSPWGFGWDTWQADFFEPAAPLLAAAPWVMVRGNHESCRRAGQGWWRFLDPRRLHASQDCNTATDDMKGNYSEPYAVPIGAGAQFLVFDSANVPNRALAKHDPVYSIYLNQFKAADQLVQRADFSIFITHHPVLGFLEGSRKSQHVEIEPGDAGLQSVLKDIHPTRLFDKNVHMLLSGDTHLFEALTFKTNHPTQFVVGNGGSSPYFNLPKVVHTTPFSKAEIAQFESTNRSGFTTMERSDSQSTAQSTAQSTDWVVKSWDQHGVLMTTCYVSKLKSECSN